MQGNLPLTGGPFTHNALRCGPHPAFGSLELNPPFTGIYARPQMNQSLVEQVTCERTARSQSFRMLSKPLRIFEALILNVKLEPTQVQG